MGRTYGRIRDALVVAEVSLAFILAIGAALIVILVVVIVRVGLLGAIAALATNFILLRAPLTTGLALWWAPIGVWYIGAIAALGFGACYIARSSRVTQPARHYSLQGA